MEGGGPMKRVGQGQERSGLSLLARSGLRRKRSFRSLRDGVAMCGPDHGSGAQECVVRARSVHRSKTCPWRAPKLLGKGGVGAFLAGGLGAGSWEVSLFVLENVLIC